MGKPCVGHVEQLRQTKWKGRAHSSTISSKTSASVLSKATHPASPMLPLGLRASPNCVSGTFQPSCSLCSDRLVWSSQTSPHFHRLCTCPPCPPSITEKVFIEHLPWAMPHPGEHIPEKTQAPPQISGLPAPTHSPPHDQFSWLLFLIIFQNIQCLSHDFCHSGFSVSFSVCSV